MIGKKKSVWLDKILIFLKININIKNYYDMIKIINIYIYIKSKKSNKVARKKVTIEIYFRLHFLTLF